MEKSTKRLKVIEKIKLLEKEGKFHDEVEENPESKVLLPKNVDYLNKKLISKINTKIANKLAVKFFEGKIKSGDFIIKKINGLENFDNIKGGAIITCNHFSIYDHYAVYRAMREYLNGKLLYKIIREGNYTSFKGLFGYLFRHCNTLPLSSNISTMKKFMNAVSILLNRGEKILIFPERAMWFNYRRPRPLENGAFNIAVKNKVPVIPCFITMEDTEKLDNDGFNIQAYTINFSKPIYPIKEYADKQNLQYLKEKNYEIWKNIYEDFYGVPLSYGD